MLGKPLNDSQYTRHQMLRVTVIQTKPVLPNVQSLSTYIIPPGSKGIENNNPIRVCQQTFSVDACPRGSYLIMFQILVSDNLVQDTQALHKSMESLLGVNVAQLRDYHREDNDIIVVDYVEKPVVPKDELPAADQTKDETQPEQSETAEESKQEPAQESAEEQKVEEKPAVHSLYPHVLFVVQYIQDYFEVAKDQETAVNSVKNIYVCEDEGFEADLDLNFEQAFKLLSQLGIDSIDEDSYMARPDEEDPNQDAYDQDNGGEGSDEDDLDIF